jgi:hypothetical protein
MFIDGNQFALADEPIFAPITVFMLVSNSSKLEHTWQGLADDLGIFTKALIE